VSARPRKFWARPEDERLFWHAVLMVLAAERDRRRLKREEET
jgi:hypothetical protein